MDTPARAPAARTRRHLLCPCCGQRMVKALTDTDPHPERAMDGRVVDTTHIYYGCPNEACNTMVRLRYRKDGSKGDLWRVVEARRAGDGKALVTEIPGTLADLGDV